jgi:carboxymethylenebutenolidase
MFASRSRLRSLAASFALLSLASILILRAETPATPTSHPGTLVSLRSGKDSLGAYFIEPKGKGPFPGVVVIQEWWGLNDQIKGVADRLASEGFAAIVPDLYHGKVATDPEKAHELMRGLEETVALADLGAAMDHLRSLPEVGKGKIGSVGFCMGGGLSLRLALRRSDLAGAVMFYGSPETDPALLKSVACPVLGLFGEDDQGIPREKVEAMAKGLQEVGKGAEVKIYPKAGHAFFNETRPSYSPEAASDAWKRTLAFFQARLKG